MGYGYVDDLMKRVTPENREEPKRKNIEKRRTTLHRRDVEHIEFYIVARFVHALKKVRVKVKGEPPLRMPQVMVLGEVQLNLPVWYKSGAGWQLAGYETFAREGLGVTVDMMRAIANHLGYRESAILTALHNLSMISVTLAPDMEKRLYRQLCIGKFINPADCQPLSFDEVETEGFVLDRKRVEEWMRKIDRKREHSGK